MKILKKATLYEGVYEKVKTDKVLSTYLSVSFYHLSRYMWYILLTHYIKYY